MRFSYKGRLFLHLTMLAVILSCDGNLAREKERSAEPTPSVSNTETIVSQSLSAKPWEDRLIAPGVGTNSIRLDMSRDELIAALGKPSEEYDHRHLCTYSELHWFPPTKRDGSVDGDGIFAFVKEGKVFELMFGKGFYTAYGVKHALTLKDLKKKIAAPLFELTNSANTATNGENLLFMIERDKGIAYELAAAYKTRERIVSGIYVFRPSFEFLPWGCVDENQSLREVSK